VIHHALQHLDGHRRWQRRSVLIRATGAVLAVMLAATASAQDAPPRTSRDTLGIRKDSSAGPAVSSAPVRRQSTLTRGRAPLIPRRAFVYSAVLPGLGQSRLDRGTAGALFASVELAAIIMVRRSGADLREARRFRADTLPAEFTITNGKVTKSGTVVSRYTADLERTRRLHVEDWLAALAFNHLFAGVDAFVAAQLWDMPVQLQATPTPSGAAVVATLRF